MSKVRYDLIEDITGDAYDEFGNPIIFYNRTKTALKHKNRRFEKKEHKRKELKKYGGDTRRLLTKAYIKDYKIVIRYEPYTVNEEKKEITGYHYRQVSHPWFDAEKPGHTIYVSGNEWIPITKDVTVTVTKRKRIREKIPISPYVKHYRRSKWERYYKLYGNRKIRHLPVGVTINRGEYRKVHDLW